MIIAREIFDEAAFDGMHTHPGVERTDEPSGITFRAFFNRNTGYFLSAQGGLLGDRSFYIRCDVEHTNEVATLFADGAIAQAQARESEAMPVAGVKAAPG